MKELKKLKQMFASKSFVAFAYLFGSRAKGFFNQRSDWDVAVYLLEAAKGIDPWIEFKLEAEISRALDSNAQITVLRNNLPPVFGFEIISKGVLLICKDEMLRMDFETRMLRNYYDWHFFLRRQMEAVHFPSLNKDD